MKAFNNENPLTLALSRKGEREKRTERGRLVRVFESCGGSRGRAVRAPIIVCFLLGVLVTGCGRVGDSSVPATANGFSGVEATSVVARVEGQAIPLERFQKALLQRGLAMKKEALLDEMIRQQALVARAKAAGYDRDPEIVAAFEQMIAA